MELFFFDVFVGTICLLVGGIGGYIAGRMDLTVGLIKGTSTTTSTVTTHPIKPVLPVSTTTSVTTPVT
jgi:hypothetical protein